MSIIGLFEKSKTYKPFRYSWAYEYWQKQQRIHWVSEEVSMSRDIVDWKSRLNVSEIDFLNQIFRFFTQSDIDVASGYIELYLNKFHPTEIRMMLLSFANSETMHISAYASIIETLGIPEDHFNKFMEYEALKNKYEFIHSLDLNNDQDLLYHIAIYGAFIEGMQLFGSFAMLLNFQRHKLMQGMGQIIAWSVRDESLHTEGVIRLFHAYADESDTYTRKIKKKIREVASHIVSLEEDFIDLAFSSGEQRDLYPEDLKKYIHFLCDHRLRYLFIEPIYEIHEHPLPWLLEILNGVEHSNFFETRATEYSKGSTKGNWQDIWNNLK